jgi:hypothetical protein
VTLFVRMKNGATWHWCSNCPQYPTNDVDTVEALPRDARRCRTCLDLAKSGGCTAAKKTLTTQPFGRGTRDGTSEFVPPAPSNGVATRTAGSETATQAATATQRKFLTHEQRVTIEAELRATNWLPTAEAKIVKEDILIKYETLFALQGFFPKDIAELFLMVEKDVI